MNRLYYLALKLAARLSGNEVHDIHSKLRNVFIGSTRDAKKHLQYLIELGNLKPHERVLDVSCGEGWKADALAGYLDFRGSYEGLDIVPELIEECQERIRRGNFHFWLLDVYNGFYNPTGNLPSSGVAFPYQTGWFDFVILNSVFTHMLPRDMENYLREISRVLKPGGRCYISYFLINDQSEDLIDRSVLQFEYVGARYWTIDEQTPEKGIAYGERVVRALYRKHGLEITEPIHFGSWCGRKDYLDFQDIIVARAV